MQTAYTSLAQSAFFSRPFLLLSISIISLIFIIVR